MSCPVCGHPLETHATKDEWPFRLCPETCAGCNQPLEIISSSCPVCMAALDFLGVEGYGKGAA